MIMIQEFKYYLNYDLNFESPSLQNFSKINLFIINENRLVKVNLYLSVQNNKT